MSSALISANDLLTVAVSSERSRDDAVGMILDALIGGSVTAIGTEEWPAEARLRNKRNRVDVSIPPAFWRESGMAERSKWSWSTGVFASVPNFEGLHFPNHPHLYRDVRFYAAALLKELQAEPLPLLQKTDGHRVIENKGGAPRKSEMWDAITIALVRLANEGKFDSNMETRFSSAAEARRAVRDDPDVKAYDPKDETIKPLIRKVWAAMEMLP